MLKMQINSNATKQMENVIAKIDRFPNRIAAVQDGAMLRSINQIVERLVKTNRAAKHLVFRIERSGNLGVKLHIEPPSTSNLNAYYAAVIFIKGRKGGRLIRGKNGGIMKLRKESVSKGYPPFLKVAKLGPVQSKERKIKDTSRDIIIENLRYMLKQYGFGPRGGTAGVEADIPKPRIRK